MTARAPLLGARPRPGRRPAGSLRRRAARVAVIGALAVATGACAFAPGPHPTSAPAPTGSPEGVVRQVFGPLGVADQAVRVAACESGLDPGAMSAGGTYRGLFQLGPHLAGTVGFYGGNWFDPLTNSEVARDLYLRSGWSSWPACGR
jgi:hypothetical protein